jgi:hypothetical protein
VHFTVTSHSRTPLDVTIRADVPADANDPDPANNSNPTSVTWTPPPVQPFALDGSPTATATGPNDFDVVVSVKNIPADTTQLVVSLPSSQEKVNSAVGPCSMTGVDAVTCPLPSGTTSLTVRLNAQLPGKSAGAGRNPVVVTAGTKTLSTDITFP